MKKTILFVVIIFLITISLNGCNNSESKIEKSGFQSNIRNNNKEKNAEQFKIKIANIYGIETPESKSMYRFRDIILEKSNGSLEVEIYPNCHLGNEETLVESIRQGSVEMAVVGTVMSQYLPMVTVPDIPYLFRDWEHARKALTETKIASELANGAEDIGVEVIGWSPVSFRVISSNKKISSMNDFKGMRLRMPNIPVYIEFAKNLGAEPIGITFSDLFTALKQKTIDGQENPYSVVKANKLYEVQPYMLDSMHIFCIHGWYVNKQFLEKLSEEHKKLVLESAKEAIDYCWDISEKVEKDDAKFLQDAGIQITYPDENFKKQLRDSQESVRQWFYNKYPGSKEIVDLIEKIE